MTRVKLADTNMNNTDKRASNSRDTVLLTIAASFSHVLLFLTSHFVALNSTGCTGERNFDIVDFLVVLVHLVLSVLCAKKQQLLELSF